MRKSSAHKASRGVVLIVGGTGALARAPRALVETGFSFALLGRNDAHARSGEEAFRRAGGEALGIAADVLKDGALGEAFEAVRARFGAPPRAVIWNVGFVPWPAPEGWDPGAIAKAVRDEARAFASLAQAAIAAWAPSGEGTGAGPDPGAAPPSQVITIEGHSSERAAGKAPITGIVQGVRGAALEQLAVAVPGLIRTRVLLGALPSGALGEGRWLSQDEIAMAVAEALTSPSPRVVAGDLALAEEIMRRFRPA